MSTEDYEAYEAAQPGVRLSKDEAAMCVALSCGWWRGLLCAARGAQRAMAVNVGPVRPATRLLLLVGQAVACAPLSSAVAADA